MSNLHLRHFSVFALLVTSALVASPAEAGCTWVSRGLKSYLKCSGDVAKVAGKATKTLQKKLGKPIAKGGQQVIKETAKFFDKTGREVGNAGRAINRYAIENPEDLVAIAAVAAVGWAACVDGCAFVGGLLVNGGAAGGTAGGLVAIPLISMESTKDNESGELARLRRPVATKTPKDPQSQATEFVYNNPQLDKEYPHKYSAQDYPSPIGMRNASPRVSYRSLDESLGQVFNEFAPPSRVVSVRYPDPQDDPAGGVFLSPREISDDDTKSLAAFGHQARRIHAATDYLMPPGHPVVATLTGVVDGDPWEPKPGVKAVSIRSRDGTVSRVLYIHPDVNIRNGTSVKAGETVLGRAADLSTIPSYKGVPNHVHVDYTDLHGRRFDPWTNMVSEQAPGIAIEKR